MQKILGFVLLLVAYGLLFPGLTQPMLSVEGTVEKTKLVDVGKEILSDSEGVPGFVRDLADRMLTNMRVSGNVEAFSKTNSILSTANELYQNNHVPVAALILLFSVGIPLLKVLLLLAAHLPFGTTTKRRLLWFSAASSKWSMADVFVVAIFVAFLAANGIKESRALVDFNSELGPGFYFFLGYCLISILGTQLVAGSVSWNEGKRSDSTARAVRAKSRNTVASKKSAKASAASKATKKVGKKASSKKIAKK